jgi:phosphoribosylanthranilate isomerase
VALWIKICGVVEAGDAVAALEAGADAIGLNFHPPSKRFCSPERARAVRDALPADFPVYGVFVDRARAEIARVLASGVINAVQLHGREPEEDALGWEVPVLRAVAADRAETLADALGRAAGRYRVLIDNAAGGGSGQVVADEVLAGVPLAEAVLAGGLTPQNVAARVARYRPFGVDVAGGVEGAPGLKDRAKIREFIDHARAA